jgi:hypothetical protein
MDGTLIQSMVHRGGGGGGSSQGNCHLNHSSAAKPWAQDICEHPDIRKSIMYLRRRIERGAKEAKKNSSAYFFLTLSFFCVCRRSF